MTLHPTRQQQDVIDAFHTGGDVTISAGAGCGKSSTLEMVARSTNKRGLLIAFNRAVAEEAERKMRGTSTKALNTHRIAYAWARDDKTGAVVLDKMRTSQRVRRDQIARSFHIGAFNYRDGSSYATLRATEVVDVALGTLDAFLKDGTTEITSAHVPYVRGFEGAGDHKFVAAAHAALSSIVVPYARNMWQDICSASGNSMRVTHDAYLKLWAMSKPVLPYDFILLDEAQDTNPAVFSVFDSQEAQKISVGDACQQLFAWNGSVNIMEKFQADLHVKLTQSWRFGLAIQDAANIFLDKLNADIRLQGNPRVQSVLEVDAAFDPHKSSSTLVRTNAGAIQELLFTLSAGQTAHLIGGNRAFVAMVEAAEKLKTGKTVTHPDFMGFKSWSEVQEYVNDDPAGLDLKVIVNLIDTHGSAALLNALNKCTENEADAQTVISTVHKVKGREWDQVRLGSDFERARQSKKGQKDSGISKEDLMLYYVAVTRAKELLDPGPLARFTGQTGLDFMGNGVEQITTGISDSLSIKLDDDLRTALQARFDNQEEVEKFVLEMLRSDSPSLDAAKSAE